MATKKEETLPAVKEEAGLPATIDFAADAGAGFEGADGACYAIPFIRMLQAITPQAKKKDPDYIEGAEEGDFFNTVTNKLYKGDDGVLVVPCAFIHRYNAWAPNRGGYRGSFTADEYNALTREKRTDNKGNQYEADAATGNQLIDTREHYLIVINADGSTERVLLCLASTELKKSKKWMSMMDAICGTKLPMFSQVYKLTPTPEHNDQGDWSGLKVEHVGQVTKLEIYEAAKKFNKMIRTGAAQPSSPASDDDVPF